MACEGLATIVSDTIPLDAKGIEIGDIDIGGIDIDGMGSFLENELGERDVFAWLAFIDRGVYSLVCADGFPRCRGQERHRRSKRYRESKERAPFPTITCVQNMRPNTLNGKIENAEKKSPKPCEIARFDMVGLADAQTDAQTDA